MKFPSRRSAAARFVPRSFLNKKKTTVSPPPSACAAGHMYRKCQRGGSQRLTGWNLSRSLLEYWNLNIRQSAEVRHPPPVGFFFFIFYWLGRCGGGGVSVSRTTSSPHRHIACNMEPMVHYHQQALQDLVFCFSRRTVAITNPVSRQTTTCAATRGKPVDHFPRRVLFFFSFLFFFIYISIFFLFVFH